MNKLFALEEIRLRNFDCKRHLTFLGILLVITVALNFIGDLQLLCESKNREHFDLTLTF